MSLLKFEQKHYVNVGDRRYRIVQIGNQWWMAENLCNVFPNMSLGSQFGDANYYDNSDSYEANGLLYSPGAVEKIVNSTGWLPTGWRVPSISDFNALFTAVGGTETAGYHLKSTTGWYNDSNGVDDFKFNGKPVGLFDRDSNNFHGLTSVLSLWTSSYSYGSYGDVKADYFTLSTGNGIDSGNTMRSKYSVRLVKDA